jgi:hypothetical protein
MFTSCMVYTEVPYHLNYQSSQSSFCHSQRAGQSLRCFLRFGLSPFPRDKAVAQKTLLSVGLGKRSRSSLSRVSFKICVVCARVCKQKSVKIFAVRGSGTRL